MEDQRIPPHGDRNSVVPEGETEGTDEKAFGLRKHPNAEQEQKVDEVAKVGQEVVISSLVIRVVPDREKIAKLRRIPDVKPFWKASDKISTDEDVEYTRDERDLFPSSDCLVIVPPRTQPVDRVSHALSISIELLVRGWNSLSPFVYHFLPSLLR